MFSVKQKHSNDQTLLSIFSSKKRFVLLLAISVGMCVAPHFALAAVESDPRLARMEVKFFERDYAKQDDVATRLDRLEKLIFGEAKTGDQEQRFNNLLGAVPNLDRSVTADGGEAGGSADQAAVPQDQSTPQNQSAPTTASKSPARSADEEAITREENIAGSSQYPAVTAIEKRLFNKDYAGEPIVKRLERLETKEFGKPSTSDDLSERVDRLKSQTGVDLARMAPPGSDWADDEDRPASGGGSVTFTPGNTTPYTSQPGEDGMSFSGRDLRSDAQRALGRPVTSSWGDENGVIDSSRGSYGGGSAPSRASTGYGSGGSYGYNPPRKSAASSGLPQPAPDVVRQTDGAPPTALGLSQQVGLLENELFRKSFSSDTIPSRLTRLEGVVFPGQAPSTDMAMPARVRRLTEAVPVSGSSSSPIAHRSADTVPYDDSGMPPSAPQRGGGGLSKIMSGLGNLISGGGYAAYPTGSNLYQDPQTGLLIDRTSGNMIDPATGVVVGSRAISTYPGINRGYAVGTNGGYPVGTNGGYPIGTSSGGGYSSGFNNGLSPLGGYGSSMRFGFGGGGMPFGGMGSGMGIGF